MISCVIFDCDGTLVDSEYLCNLGLVIKLREYGIESNARQMMMRFRGAKLSLIVEQLETESQVDFGEGFISSYRDIVESLFEKRLGACECVVEMLETIRLPVCVASSGPIEKIHKALSLTRLLGYFNGNLFSSYEIKSWKPDPDIFVHAANEMGFKPAQCAIVEDSALGISAAISSGGLPIHYNSNSTHDSIEGVHQISDMSQLVGLIDQLSNDG